MAAFNSGPAEQEPGRRDEIMQASSIGTHKHTHDMLEVNAWETANIMKQLVLGF